MRAKRKYHKRTIAEKRALKNKKVRGSFMKVDNDDFTIKLGNPDDVARTSSYLILGCWSTQKSRDNQDWFSIEKRLNKRVRQIAWKVLNPLYFNKYRTSVFVNIPKNLLFKKNGYIRVELTLFQKIDFSLLDNIFQHQIDLLIKDIGNLLKENEFLYLSKNKDILIIK